jgi:hypothetical protein
MEAVAAPAAVAVAAAEAAAAEVVAAVRPELGAPNVLSSSKVATTAFEKGLERRRSLPSRDFALLAKVNLREAAIAPATGLRWPPCGLQRGAP